MDNKYDMLLLENQVCFPAYAVANKILRQYQPLLKKIDLTYTQYIAMMVLWEKKRINEKVLVEALFLQANTLTNLLKNLKTKGFVNIEKDEKDRRNIIISLTKKGEELRDKALEVPQTLSKKHWLSDEELATFKNLLYKLLKGDWQKC